VRQPDEKNSFYETTKKEQGYLENPPEEVEGEEQERSPEAKSRSEVQTILRRNQ